jgi:hypothetical protein
VAFALGMTQAFRVKTLMQVAPLGGSSHMNHSKFVERGLFGRDNWLVRLSSSSVQEFIDFLSKAEGKAIDSDDEDSTGSPFGVNADCPVFPGLFSFCQVYAGASVGTAPLVPLLLLRSSLCRGSDRLA